MRLWISRNSEVPIHEQLVTQIILGIVSKDLKVKQRLPSTRDLARRYQIHPNTVSAAYRELARRNWVDFKKGSGVYVKSRTPEELKTTLSLEHIVGRFFRELRSQGHSLGSIQVAVQRSLAAQGPDHFLLLESDPELRSILAAEIEQATQQSVIGIDPATMDQAITAGGVPTVLFGHFHDKTSSTVYSGDLIVLHSASVIEAMHGHKKPTSDSLIAIVSRWPEFLRWSKTMLLAAGVDQDALSFRDARQRGWDKGLRHSTFVITDSLMAPQIPGGCDLKVFRVISQTSIGELVEYARNHFPEVK
jgi:DNA-binding transcriptional regulator YhcF (GntR family)